MISLRAVFLAPLALAVVLSSLPAASATPITRTFDFTAYDFYIVDSDLPPPFDPVNGSVTVTFDPSRGAIRNTDGVEINDLNSGWAYTPAFNYYPDIDELAVGEVTPDGYGPQGFRDGTTDFTVFIEHASSDAPYFGAFEYTEPCTPSSCLEFSGGAWRTNTGSLSFSAGSVDEPHSVALFEMGLLALFASRRRVSKPPSLTY